MKLFIGSTAALAAVLGLSACGGGSDAPVVVPTTTVVVARATTWLDLSNDLGFMSGIDLATSDLAAATSAAAIGDVVAAKAACQAIINDVVATQDTLTKYSGPLVDRIGTGLRLVGRASFECVAGDFTAAGSDFSLAGTYLQGIAS